MNTLSVTLSLTDRQLGCVQMALAHLNKERAGQKLPPVDPSFFAMQRISTVEQNWGAQWDKANPAAAQSIALSAALQDAMDSVAAAQEAAATVAAAGHPDSTAAAALSSTLAAVMTQTASVVSTITAGSTIIAPTAPVDAAAPAPDYSYPAS